MEWFLCIVIAVLIGACRIFINNYITDYYFKGKDANAQKNFYWLPFIITGLSLICISGINFGDIPFYTYLFFFLTGASTAIAGIFYYKALELSNSTDFGIFSQLSPIFYLILGWFFLGQSITSIQLIAFFIILSGPILIVLTTRKRSRHLKIKAILYTLLDIAISAIAASIFVKLDSSNINFASEIGLILLGNGIGNAIIMLLKPKWRKRYHFVLKSSHYKVLFPLICDAILEVVVKFARNYALIIASSIALTSAIIDSTKPLVIFFIGILFSILWPKFGREKMNRKTIIVHLIATILVVIGICLIQSS